MKLLIMLSLLLTAQVAMAREYQLGVILGAPTGISGKVELGKNRSVDGVLAYSLADDLSLEFHSDYLIENAHGFNVGAPNLLELYFGIGGRFAIIDKGEHDGDVAIGPRAPIGVSYKTTNPNLEFFGEVALVLDIIPETNADFEGGLGMRFRF
ncbi:MAG: hypothetical protein ACXVLQ_14030 [Bacteriovorax sp.]